MNLADAPMGRTVTVETVGGQGSFRRRLLELGLLPGTAVKLTSIAPLGDPIELLVRGASLSIRRSDARVVEVRSTKQRSDFPTPQKAHVDFGDDGWAGSTP